MHIIMMSDILHAIYRTQMRKKKSTMVTQGFLSSLQYRSYISQIYICGTNINGPDIHILMMSDILHATYNTRMLQKYMSTMVTQVLVSG